ncbi:MAG TPA: type IV pilus biogenesis/stability protein PilW [Povalibacter sp.]|nr:type IV pilus biogenesis/stability protein PilW [Povalibacter sp.]
MIRPALIATLLSCAVAACTTTSTQPLSVPQPNRASDINLELGVDYFRKGNLKAAKEKLDRAVEQNPRNARAHAASGLLYDTLNDPKKSDSHFVKALDLDPQNPEILNNYAVILCKRGKAEQGEKYFVRAASNPLYKTPEVAYLNAGNCARGAGDLKNAEGHFRKALSVSPRFARALYEMADLEYQQNNYLSARGFLERYLETGRTDSTTLWLALRIEQGLGNAAGASSYAQRLKSEYPSAAETQELLKSERNSG